MVATENGAVRPKDSGQVRLEALGYKQMLKRDLGVISNFSLSFTFVAILAGVSILYGTGLRYGGPISMVYGWLIAALFNFCVALSMAEICSAYPTSGGLYYWSYTLAGPSWGPFAAWITGCKHVPGYLFKYNTAMVIYSGLIWLARSVGPKIFCELNKWAATASVEFSLATLLQAMILLSTGGGNGGGYLVDKYVIIGFQAGILVIHGLVNSCSIKIVSYLGTLGSIWNFVGVLVMMILIPLVSTQRQSAEFVFTHLNTDTGAGIHSKPYIFFLGLLICPFALFGYDASAHMTEETKSADINGAYGILTAVGTSSVLGFAYLVGLSFATPDPQRVLDPANDAGGYAIGQVFYDAFYSRYGSGVGGIISLGVVGASVWFGGMAAMTSNSRMVFAFSRDGALPLSRLWHSVNKRNIPFNAVWLSAFMALLIALPSLGSLVAFQAMISIATVAIYIAYVLPTFFRITLARNTFIPGPFHMGKRVSLVVGWLAVLFVGTITVLFFLPTVYPITSETLNYTPVALGSVLVIILSWWILDARKWFKGPVRTLEKAENGFHPI